MALKVLPKPQGYDLRNIRAMRENNASIWLPEDAVFDASCAMKTEPPAVACVVAWYTRLENGNLALKYRCFQEHDRQSIALAADLLGDLQA